MKGIMFADDCLQPIPSNSAFRDDGSVTYSLLTKRYSHWKYKDETSLEFLSDTKIAVRDGWNGFHRDFDSRKTAIMVMDPWINSPCDFLDEYYGKNLYEKLVPFVLAAEKSGHHIVILSDSPEGKYNSKIPTELQDLVDAGRAKFFVHAADNAEKFSEYAKENGIEKFIYTGYCSNLCILNRPLGIPKVLGLQLGEVFFMPDCSAAMEHKDTWENQLVHQASTLLISQGMALLVEYDDIMNAIKRA